MKAKVIIPLSNSGILSAHGYEDVREKSELARHRALMRVVRAGEPPLGLFRRLNVLMILFKNKDPKLSKIFKKDRDWVREKLLWYSSIASFESSRRTSTFPWSVTQTKGNSQILVTAASVETFVENPLVVALQYM